MLISLSLTVTALRQLASFPLAHCSLRPLRWCRATTCGKAHATTLGMSAPLRRALTHTQLINMSSLLRRHRVDHSQRQQPLLARLESSLVTNLVLVDARTLRLTLMRCLPPWC